MANNALVLIIFLFFTVSCAHPLPDFTSRLSTRLPTTEKPQAIGEYSLGCLQGAQTFTGKEKGLVLSQTKRGRYWGHPDLIDLLSRAGHEFSKLNKKMIVGDLSQSRGGPTLTGHNSHQTGLDVDIWFKMPAERDELSFRELETEEMRPIEKLGDDQVKLIQFFAQSPEVERIFINPRFKKDLCMGTTSLKLNPEEQHKLRAWWGHDDHIHVRLRCPSDDIKCVSQKPIPAGDGCGDDLHWWFTDEAKLGEKDASWEEMKSTYLEKVGKLPAECSFYKD